jgi:crotonobetainyl-CoA:carnitine CoA-transferase CaiB-like acyl-CoA transferase
MSGVKIVDLSIALAGPWAVTMLADQGASVIKVEPPGLGDIGRWVGVRVGGISAMAAMVNRGKRSIAVDLQSDEGPAIVERIVAEADVFVQNFRPGVIEKLGLSYERLRAVNPELIYCSISGFGPEGPYAQKSAYDPVVQAYGGLAFAQAGGADAEPQLIRHTAADKITALNASQAITAALFARERGQGGQHLQLSMLEAVVNFVWADAAGNEILLESGGSTPSSFARDQKLWPTKDGYVIAAPVSDADVAGICRGVGVEGYDAPEVATIVARRANPEAFTDLLRRVVAAVGEMTTAEAIAGMEAENAPCGAVLSPAELCDDPHVRAIGMLEDSVHPLAGRMRQPRPAARFAVSRAKTASAAPGLGEHTDEILAEIGLADRVEALRASGVVS